MSATVLEAAAEPKAASDVHVPGIHTDVDPHELTTAEWWASVVALSFAIGAFAMIWPFVAGWLS